MKTLRTLRGVRTGLAVPTRCLRSVFFGEIAEADTWAFAGLGHRRGSRFQLTSARKWGLHRPLGKEECWEVRANEALPLNPGSRGADMSKKHP